MRGVEARMMKVDPTSCIASYHLAVNLYGNFAFEHRKE